MLVIKSRLSRLFARASSMQREKQIHLIISKEKGGRVIKGQIGTNPPPVRPTPDALNPPPPTPGARFGTCSTRAKLPKNPLSHVRFTYSRRLEFVKELTNVSDIPIPSEFPGGASFLEEHCQAFFFFFFRFGKTLFFSGGLHMFHHWAFPICASSEQRLSPSNSTTLRSVSRKEAGFSVCSFPKRKTRRCLSRNRCSTLTDM